MCLEAQAGKPVPQTMKTDRLNRIVNKCRLFFAETGPLKT
ncbi:hypothetical protein FTUN_1781 [Frigoriglobus tundricola]|uniref:Uncharacterized protein n=1 Tax=Frigoriglobus tundricola TaxID=2774151 RepID=A0A6M5YLY5_9BACT|nr:hypothetical protein FTUN_1781 [Frigoriglobus tundricola]